jgi:hypothetical protein
VTATVRSTGSANSASSPVTSFSPTMPAGFIAGDLLIGIANNGGGAVPTSQPSGSTPQINVDDGTVFNMDVVTKVAVGGDVFTWTTGIIRNWAGCVIAITAGTYNPTTPVQGVVGVAQGTTAALTFVTPASTPGNTDSLIIAAFGAQVVGTWTDGDTSPTMVELADTTSTGTGGGSCSAYRSSAPPAASSLTRTGTTTISTADGGAFLLFVNPAVLAAWPERNQRSPQPSEQSNVAGPYAQSVSTSQLF